MNSDDFRPDPEDYRIDTGAVRCLKPAQLAFRGGAIGCYNSAAADRHAHEEGIFAALDDKEREEAEAMLEALEDGGEITIDIGGKPTDYDASTVLAECPGKPIYKALVNWCFMHVSMRMDHLRRINADYRAESRLEDAA